MARILFISTGVFENLGIEYLSAHLKVRGHAVGLVIEPLLFQDVFFQNKTLAQLLDPRKTILTEIDGFSPDIICFSVVTDNYQRALALAGAIRSRTKAFIIFGGIHPTLAPAMVLENSCLDAVCVGEGEGALAELADSFDAGAVRTDINNIWFKGQGGIIKNPLAPINSDLDDLPFPDKEIYYAQNPVYKKTYMAITSRGCHFDCSYCSNHSLRKLYGKSHVRKRTPDNVIRELSLAKEKHAPEYVWFVDDMFFWSEEWLKEFCESYRQKVNLPFFCYLHPTSVTEAVVRLLKDANCHEIGIGIQSIDPVSKSAVSRNESLGEIRAAMGILKKHGILTVTENIVGLPSSSHENLLDLAGFYAENKPDLIIANWLRLYPQTDLLEREAQRFPDVPLERLVETGTDTGMGWKLNVRNPALTKKAAILLESAGYLPAAVISAILYLNLYRYIPLWFGSLNRLARILKFSPLGGLFYQKATYDSGARVYLQSCFYFAYKKIMVSLSGMKKAYRK
ncbi:MAG: radical SAM protein [Elusimicrobiota bacterium]